MIEQWGVPAISLAALVVWSLVSWRGRGLPSVPLLWLITMSTACLLITSLTYPGVLSPETGRIVNTVQRVVLALAGAYALGWGLARLRRAWLGQAPDEVRR